MHQMKKKQSMQAIDYTDIFLIYNAVSLAFIQRNIMIILIKIFTKFTPDNKLNKKKPLNKALFLHGAGDRT